MLMTSYSERRDFKRLAKALDPNEATLGYLQAIERDLARLTLIERRLKRIELATAAMLKVVGAIVVRLEEQANAVEEGQVKRDDQPQHPRDESRRPSAEAGGGGSIVDRPQVA